jgi:NAD(P)-dependent dehydrogenase (short-subunit alcohol dehydrogenase family)
MQDFTLEVWDTLMNINLRSTWIVMHALQKRIPRGGKVVLVSSCVTKTPHECKLHIIC